MHRPWTDWPQPSADPMQTEHRLTRLEVVTDEHGRNHDEHFETSVAHRDRLNLHERLILTLAGILSILLQDKFPKLAALIKGAMP